MKFRVKLRVNRSYILAVRDSHARYFESGENARKGDVKSKLSQLNVLIKSNVVVNHNLTLWGEAEASHLPSGEKSTIVRPSSEPSRVERHAPVFRHQILIVPSSEPDAS